MKRTVILITLIAVAQAGFSQDDGKGTIDAQRPTLTESYSIIIPNMVQFENGIDYFNENDTVLYGTFFRGSVTNRFELRGFTDYTQLNSVGAKFLVMEPDSTWSGIGASFIYSRALSSNTDDFRLALTRSFSKVLFTYNFGFNGDIYNIVLIGIPLGDQVNYFIEYYNDPALNRIHSGLTWIPVRDLQFDVNGGWMDTNAWYAGLGVSFRIR